MSVDNQVIHQHVELKAKKNHNKLVARPQKLNTSFEMVHCWRLNLKIASDTPND